MQPNLTHVAMDAMVFISTLSQDSQDVLCLLAKYPSHTRGYWEVVDRLCDFGFSVGEMTYQDQLVLGQILADQILKAIF